MKRLSPPASPGCAVGRSTRLLLGLAIAPSLLLLPTTAWADHGGDDPDEDLAQLLEAEVEGVSRYAESTLDAPAVVRVFPREDARLLGHTTVGEMLQRLPGGYLTTDRTYASFGLRGFNRPGDYNSRTLLTIDGYRVNDVIYDQALPDLTFPLPADWVKRTELIYGPASSVYGGNALFGVANFVTLDGADAPGAAARVSLGSFGSRRAMAQYGYSSGNGGGNSTNGQGSDVFIGVVGYRSRGEDLSFPELASAQASDGVARGLDGTRQHALLAKTRFGRWRATLVASERDKDIATGEYGTAFGVPGTHYVDSYGYGELAWDGAWSAELRTSARASVSTYRYRGRYMFEDGGPALTVNHDDLKSRWFGAEWRLQWRGWTNHAVVAGMDLRRTLEVRLHNFDEDPPNVVQDARVDSTGYGFFAQDQVRLSERWSLTLGARLDHAATHTNEFSPRLALVWRPSTAHAWKLSVGRAFRSPNISERYYEDGASQVANPGLRSETINTGELAWEHALDAHTRVSASIYRYRLTNMIEFVQPEDEPIGQYQNIGRAGTTGMDVELEHAGAGGWRWRASASLLRARINGERPYNSPRWLLKGHALAPVATGWWLGAELDAVGARRGPQDVDAYAVVNGVLRHALTAGHELSLRVNNLGDATAYDVPTPGLAIERVPRPRRALTLEWLSAY